jgi:PKD repeat protein
MKTIKLSLLGFLLFFILTAEVCNNMPPEDNEPPEAVITTIPAQNNQNIVNGNVPLTVFFDASNSQDFDDCQDCMIVKYEWDLDGDNVFETEGMTASYTYAVAGQYDVRLRVTDNYDQTSQAIVVVKPTTQPIAPFIKGMVVDGSNEPLLGKTVIAMPGEEENVVEFLSSGTFPYSSVTNQNGQYIIDELDPGTYYLITGFFNYDDDLGMCMEVDSLNPDMTFDELMDQIPFPIATVEENSFVIADTIMLYSGPNLLYDGDEWPEGQIDPVDITLPYTFEWEYADGTPEGGYMVTIINMAGDYESVWTHPETFDYPYEPFTDTQIVCDTTLPPDTYKVFVSAILFYPSEENPGGKIVFSEFLDGNFDITE